MTSMISIVSANDAPTLIVTAQDPEFLEDASGSVLFEVDSFSPIEAAQHIKELEFTVEGLIDSSSEQVIVDAEAINLVIGETGTTSTSSIGYSIQDVNDLVTVVLSFPVSVSPSDARTIVENIGYKNSSSFHASDGVRVFTLNRIQDDGGVANSGSDTTLFSAVSTVTVKAVNDAPTILAPVSLTTNEDESIYLVAGSVSEVSFVDVDAFSSDVKATLTTKKGRLFIDGGNASVTASGAHENWTYVVQGQISDVNSALDGAEFRPAAEFWGVASIHIEVDDLGNTGVGDNLTASQTINIRIASVEDMPILVGETSVLNTYEDEHIINHVIGLTESDPENVRLYFSAQVVDTAYTPIKSVELIKVGGLGYNYYLSVYVKPDSHGVGRIKLLYGDDKHDLEHD